METPQIPPRPIKRSQDSHSPHRESFAPSPLNAIPQFNPPSKEEQSLGNERPRLHGRTSSVKLPSIGHEGDEYAALDETLLAEKEAEIVVNVPETLPMHHPTATSSHSTGRTSSSRSDALHNSTRSHHDEDEHGIRQSLRARASFNRTQSIRSTRSRPGSVYDTDHEEVIQEDGLSVPMYPNAGFVQAPSPQNSLDSHIDPSDSGTDDGHNNKHSRQSSRTFSTPPPGSYGLHGHGAGPTDQFEKAWYHKHPEELAKEQEYHYDPGHAPNDCSLPSEDLNNLVLSTANRGLSIGALDDETGYAASEAHSSRLNSPQAKPRRMSSELLDELDDESDLRHHEPSPLANQVIVRSSQEDGTITRDVPPPIILFPDSNPPTQDNVSSAVYEPLFSEGQEQQSLPHMIPPQEKRPESLRHQFPSQDRWEDGPTSLNLTAVVSTPELPAQTMEDKDEIGSAGMFELPETEAQRKKGVSSTAERASFLPPDIEHGTAFEPKDANSLNVPSRPGLPPRFPSSDIWEDSPDSARLETTVSADAPQSLQKEEKPPRTDIRTAPEVPERPKPAIPPRPAAKPSIAATVAAFDSPEMKPKPKVPSRPVGGKIAALQAGFMSDLNSRLQLGPQIPPKKTEERPDSLDEISIVSAPLEDSRKGRVRGPIRRKVATNEASSEPSQSTDNLCLCASRLVFSIDEDGSLTSGAPHTSRSNTINESVERHLSDIHNKGNDHIFDENKMEENKVTNDFSASAITPAAVGFSGDMPEPSISQATQDLQNDLQPELSAALTPAESDVRSQGSD